MALIVPNASEVLMLKFALGVLAPNVNSSLRLFVNNITLTSGVTAASLTEMSTQNYSPITLINANWVVATVIVEAEGSYAEQTWTFDGTGGDTDVYGYYITDDTSGDLLWAERFPSAPITVPNILGGVIKVTPKITFSTLNEL